MTQPKTQKTAAPQLETPRLETSAALRIAGLRQHFAPETQNQIASLWNQFVPRIATLSSRVGRNAYGLCWTQGTPGIDYLAGAEVADTSALPADFRAVTIPPQKYLVFSHRGHVSALYETCEAVLAWLPQSGYQPVPADPHVPDFFERYTEEFNPQTGTGGMEVWVPVKS